MVNAAFADRYMPGGVVVGRRIRLDDADDADPWTEIVGLVQDGDVFGQDHENVPGLYLPLAQVTPARVAIAVRTEADPLTQLAPLRETVAALDPNLPLYEVATLRQILFDEGLEERTLGTLFGSFGMVALTMAVVGLYGVVSFGVRRRRREFGIRRALGAGTANVIWVVLRGAVAPLAVGLVVGVGLALWLAPAMGEALLETSPTDPSVYLGVTAILALATLSAALAPSIAATRVQPATALRDE